MKKNFSEFSKFWKCSPANALCGGFSLVGCGTSIPGQTKTTVCRAMAAMAKT